MQSNMNDLILADFNKKTLASSQDQCLYLPVPITRSTHSEYIQLSEYENMNPWRICTLVSLTNMPSAD